MMVRDYQKQFGKWTLNVERNFSDLIIRNNVGFTQYMNKKYYFVTSGTLAPTPPKSMFKSQRSSPSKPYSLPSNAPSQNASSQSLELTTSRRSKDRSPARDEDDEKASVLEAAERAREAPAPVPVPGLSVCKSLLMEVFLLSR